MTHSTTPYTLPYLSLFSQSTHLVPLFPCQPKQFLGQELSFCRAIEQSLFDLSTFTKNVWQSILPLLPRLQIILQL